MTIFPTFFLGNIGQENNLYDILERKKAFLRYKNKKFKKSKNWHFPNWLSHGFGPNMAIIPTFFLGNIGKKNILYDILERKNAFLLYKNKKIKKSKNLHFSKQVNPMVLDQKWAFLQLSFLGNISQKNILYDILGRKNAFLGYENKKFDKSKKWHFSKRVNPWVWSKNGHFSNFYFLTI